MTRPFPAAKEFVSMPQGFDRAAGQARLTGEESRVRAMLDLACPPVAMERAPVAPARGPQQLVPTFSVTAGGMRRVEGAHWQGLSPLAAAVAQAWRRHEARGTDAPFVPPFNPAQVAVAEDYAALVEWREGSPLRCASLEAGRSGNGGGSGLFIMTYIEQGNWLTELRRRIGDGIAMDVRRHMDRGNSRKVIRVRVALDLLALDGVAVKSILRRFGWVANIRECRDLRAAICGALDRMQGYPDAGASK
jgi:hypothetical protein